MTFNKILFSEQKISCASAICYTRDDEPCLLTTDKVHHHVYSNAIARPGDGTIDWINCTECQQWVYEGCLPHGYCFDREDDDFACPVCLTGQKY